MLWEKNDDSMHQIVEQEFLISVSICVKKLLQTFLPCDMKERGMRRVDIFDIFVNLIFFWLLQCICKLSLYGKLFERNNEES